MPPRKKKIRGTFCEVTLAPKSGFAKGSFRWKKSGAAWVLTACPKPAAKSARCATGMQAVKILRPKTGGRCKTGRTIRKG